VSTGEIATRGDSSGETETGEAVAVKVASSPHPTIAVIINNRSKHKVKSLYVTLIAFLYAMVVLS
jgi:hypothetical protein